MELPYAVGLVLGTIVLLCICYVFVKSRALGTSEIVFAFFGVVLVGLSVITSARVTVSEKGIEARIDTIATAVKTLAEANEAVSAELDKVASRAQASDARFVQLTRELEQRNALTPAAAAEISRSVAAQPKIDPQRVRALVRAIDLESLRVPPPR